MMKVLFRRISWFDPGNIISDLIAGITVGLVTIPQSFTFAASVGVPIQYAIYSALLGSLLYPILGRNKDVIVSSTVLLRELIRLYVTDGLNWFPQKAVMMTFISGLCIQLAAILSAGSLINRLSSYVLAGLVWANVLSLVTTQLHHMLGIPYRPEERAPALYLLKNLHDANLLDTALSSICVVVLLFFAVIKSLRLSSVDKEPSTVQRIAEKMVFFIGNVSGAAVLVIATAVAYQLSDRHRSFTLTVPVIARVVGYLLSSRERLFNLTG
ncbi:sodium-independent sulfate anion transporter [Anabrus simplex]|uniref:sodium-independent sulfate anion transporter n=1 Tax=Anabrus simplex TaxID=316456 RepID=UPI0035A310B5